MELPLTLLKLLYVMLIPGGALCDLLYIGPLCVETKVSKHEFRYFGSQHQTTEWPLLYKL